MASQQQPRRWFSLASFNRPARPPPRPSAPTPPYQQPVTRPQVSQPKAPSPARNPPQEIAPAKPPGPAGAPTAASVTSFPVATTSPSAPPARSPAAPAVHSPSAPAPRSPPAPNVTSAPVFVSRPAPPSALQPRSAAAAPAPATASAQRSPSTANVTPAPLFPASPSPPAAPTPKSSAPSPPHTITNTSTSLQNSPYKAASPAPSTILSIASSPSRSPPRSAPGATAVPTATIMNRAHTKISSPKTINTPPKPTTQSAQVKPISHPPSPLILPPAQIKAQIVREQKIPTDVEQKTVLVHETPAKLKTTLTISDDSETGKDVQKKLLDSEKFGTGIITLSGQNRGAIMELSTSRKKGNSNGRRIEKELASDFATLVKEAERSNIVSDKTRKIMEEQSPPKRVFINSNVQGVNNSILCNATFTHNDPGVRMSLSSKANCGHGIHPKDHTRD